MEQIKECVAYFKKQKAFDRCFLLMRKKWEIYGRTAGQVSITDASPEEQEALEGLLGRPLQRENLRFTLSQFQKALGETRFGPIPLKALLTEYFGEIMETNRDKKQKLRQEKIWFLERMEQELPGADQWIFTMREHKIYGYQLLMAEYNRNPAQAEGLLRQLRDCLVLLEERQEKNEPPIYLALLAAQTSGNPHALDRGRTAGQLLIHALCHRSVSGYPDSAQKLGELYLENGVQMDAISSMVTAYGIHLETAAGLHPACEGYIEMEEPYVITLANLEKVRGARGRWTEKTEGKPVYIVENEMVFSHLLSGLAGSAFSLLCTSGQPRTAAFVLLDYLAESGAQFFYAGDLDPEGMMIADRLWRRYPERLSVWHMGEEDYRKSMSEERISITRMTMLDKLVHPGLLATAKLVRQEALAGYQEKLAKELQGDILRGTGGSAVDLTSKM